MKAGDDRWRPSSRHPRLLSGLADRLDVMRRRTSQQQHCSICRTCARRRELSPRSRVANERCLRAAGCCTEGRRDCPSSTAGSLFGRGWCASGRGPARFACGVAAEGRDAADRCSPAGEFVCKIRPGPSVSRAEEWRAGDGAGEGEQSAHEPCMNQNIDRRRARGRS